MGYLDCLKTVYDCFYGLLMTGFVIGCGMSKKFGLLRACLASFMASLTACFASFYARLRGCLGCFVGILHVTLYLEG